MTIGQIFKQKREESGRSLEQLAALTKIHIKILRALEADSYGALPARAFTRGFIVNYAKALKLNPEQLLKEHHDFLETNFQERKDRDQGHQGYVFEGKELEQNRRWMTIGASIAVIFAAATLFVFKPQNHKHKEQHKEFEEETQLDADGEPIEAPIPPPTLKEVGATPTPTPGLLAANSTPLPLSTSASIFPPPSTPVNPSPAPGFTPNFTPRIFPNSSPLPRPTGTPALLAASPTPSSNQEKASVSPTPKPDPLNKGDGLSPEETKYKVTFQAKEDLWIRYQSDNRTIGTIILRKDRYLVIKATDKILFETNHPESLRYKTKQGYEDVPTEKGQVSSDSNLDDAPGANLGQKPLPETVPSPAAH